MKAQNQLRDEINRRGRYNEYPLYWNVRVHGWPSTETLIRHICETGHCENETDLRLQFPDIEERIVEFTNKPELFYDTIEMMQRSVLEDDVYRTFSASIARKWRLSRDELGNKKPFHVEFGFAGRSSGQLVVEKFDGVSMRDFTVYYVADYDDKFCRRLLAMIEEWDKLFDHKAVREEAAYQLASSIAMRLFL